MQIKETEKHPVGSFPQRIEIELASACNLRCSYCPRNHIDMLNGFIDFSLFRKIIDEASEHPEVILVLHRRGESLMHPDFIGICDYVKNKFQEIQLATNATLLDEARSKAIIDSINFISFSIDVPETFTKTRVPAKYGDVESNILRFLDMNKGKVKTQVSMVKTEGTPEGDPGIFKEIWKGKVDRIRVYEEHSRDGNFGSLARYRGERQTCVMPFYEMLIYDNGKVGRCNHDWNGVPMGDVTEFSINDIWNSSLYENLRTQHKTLNLTDEVCGKCDSWYPKTGEQKTGEVIEGEK